jgi:hypothetical protein
MSTSRFTEQLKLQNGANGAFLLSTSTGMQWTIPAAKLERSRSLMQALYLAGSEGIAELQVPQGYTAAWVELLKIDPTDQLIPTNLLPQCSRVRLL